MTKRVLGATRRGAAAAAITLALLTSVAGCGGGGTAATDSSPTPSTEAVSTFTVRDPWVKAAGAGMTAAFATLVNDGEEPVTVLRATSAISPVELHEMTMRDGKMVMQPKSGGFAVDANSVHVLEPGADHLMLVRLNRPLKPGDELAVTLTLSDGRTVEFTAIAKPFTGAQETYHPGHAEPTPSGTDH